jgi:hypothetical protein
MKSTRLTLAVHSVLCLALAAGQARAGYEISLSASSTDPYVTRSTPLGTNGRLYVWAVCKSGTYPNFGVSIVIADVAVSAGGTVIAFAGENGCSNQGPSATQLELITAQQGCDLLRVNEPLRLGYLLVNDGGATFDFQPSTIPAELGKLGVFYCGQASGTPTLTYFRGFSSTGGCGSTSGNTSVGCPRHYFAIGDAGWSGSFTPGSGLNDQSLALHAVSDGVIVGGKFSQAGTVTAGKIAKWDGQQWSAMGSISTASNDYVQDIEEYQGSIYATGVFNFTSLKHLARWTGSTWTIVGPGLGNPGIAMTNFGGNLVVGGGFLNVGDNSLTDANGVVAWTGTAFSALGTGVSQTGTAAQVRALAVYNSELIAGGEFDAASGTPVRNIARWNGTTWAALGGGTSNGTNGSVLAMHVYNGDLLVGGKFTEAGGHAGVGGLAKWNHSTNSWSAMSCDPTSGSIEVHAFVDYKLPLSYGYGDLIAAGEFNELSEDHPAPNIARWNGSSWEAVGASGLSVGFTQIDPGLALASFGDSLYVAGSITAAGGVASQSFALWSDDDMVGVEPGGSDSRGSQPLVLKVVPNPSAHIVSVSYSVVRVGFASVSVHDVTGRTVRVLRSGNHERGEHMVNWDTEGLPSGVYFARLKSQDGVGTAKIVVTN